MIIDTHAHLGDKRLEWFMNSDLNSDKITTISIGCTLSEIERSKQIAERYKNIFFSAGAYPFNSIGENRGLSDEKILGEIEKYISHPKCVAVGECGFDLSVPSKTEKLRTLEEQTVLLYNQLILARKYSKPTILHIRNATKEALDYISSNKDLFSNSVWHCYTENETIARKILDFGLMISLTGIITYNSAASVREAVKYIPIERLLIETDSPYLVPDPLRKTGEKLNNPTYVKIVAETISQIKQLKYAEVERITTENAIKFFKLSVKEND